MQMKNLLTVSSLPMMSTPAWEKTAVHCPAFPGLLSARRGDLQVERIEESLLLLLRSAHLALLAFGEGP